MASRSATSGKQEERMVEAVWLLMHTPPLVD